MWEHFFDREKKLLNPYIKKILEYEQYIKYDKEEMNSLKGKWGEFFKNNNPIYLEIGSGQGNFSVRSAEKFQDKNYIGMEIRFKRLYMSAVKADKRNLTNVLFLRRRGEELADLFEKDEIDGIHINFPDPWDKKVKKRMIQEKLFVSLDKVMKKGGKLFFKTDHKEYYESVLELMGSINGYKVLFYTDDLHNSEKNEMNVRTEFEELFIRKGMKTNYIEIEKEV